MSQLSQHKNGNNKRSRAWVFTWFNWDESSLKALSQLSGVKRLRYQEEETKADKNHLQGVVEFKNQKRFTEVLKWLGTTKIRIKPARDVARSGIYCQKDDSHVEGGVRISYGVWPREVKDPLEGQRLREWQAAVEEKVNWALDSYTGASILTERPGEIHTTKPNGSVECGAKPPLDDRLIHWYVDERGGMGKTTYAKHLLLSYPDAVCYITGGAAKDIAYTIATFVNDKAKDLRVVLFDFPRCVDGHVSYMAMEQIKNGLVFSPKYESTTVVFNQPLVIVLANWGPDREKMSQDRWRVTNLRTMMEQ